MTRRIYPVFRYADARAAIAFLERAFGFHVRAVFDGPDGSVAHAELAFGTGTVGLSSAGPVTAANVWTTVREGVYACIANPDAHHERARTEGATIEQPLRDTEYGSREYTARDPEGRLWSFGTYSMSDVEGPSVLVPELRYDDAAAAVTFLTRAFGLEPGLRVPDASGQVVHAELWLAESAVMVAGGLDSDDWWRGRSQCTQVKVADPDGHFARATAAGADIVRPIADTPYGARGYLVQDPEGILWGFSTYQPRR
jgi:uncharacterized glyoxalase superfamily protein PhnB